MSLSNTGLGGKEARSFHVTTMTSPRRNKPQQPMARAELYRDAENADRTVSVTLSTHKRVKGGEYFILEKVDNVRLSITCKQQKGYKGSLSMEIHKVQD